MLGVLYAALKTGTVEYKTHQEQYLYQISGLFMSGSVPATCLLVLYLCLAVVLWFLVSMAEGGSVSRAGTASLTLAVPIDRQPGSTESDKYGANECDANEQMDSESGSGSELTTVGSSRTIAGSSLLGGAAAQNQAALVAQVSDSVSHTAAADLRTDLRTGAPVASTVSLEASAPSARIDRASVDRVEPRALDSVSFSYYAGKLVQRTKKVTIRKSIAQCCLFAILVAVPLGVNLGYVSVLHYLKNDELTVLQVTSVLFCSVLFCLH